MKKRLLFALLLLFTYSAHLLAQFNDPDSRVNIMSYNVRNGLDMNRETNYKRVADVIKHVSPDVVAIQELDSVTGRNKLYVLEELSKLSDIPYYTYGAAIDYNGGKYGIGVLSKEKPLSYKNIPLPGKEERRTLLLVEFDKYVLLCTHFSLTAEDQLESAKIICQIAENIKSKPVFLAGDLNAKPSSLPIIELTKSFDILSDTSVSTFPSHDSSQCIDYIMVTPNGHEVGINFGYVYNEPLASDHRPVVVGVSF